MVQKGSEQDKLKLHQWEFQETNIIKFQKLHLRELFHYLLFIIIIDKTDYSVGTPSLNNTSSISPSIMSITSIPPSPKYHSDGERYPILPFFQA